MKIKPVSGCVIHHGTLSPQMTSEFGSMAQTDQVCMRFQLLVQVLKETNIPKTFVRTFSSQEFFRKKKPKKKRFIIIRNFDGTQ